MATVTMRTATSGTLQRWLRMVNPADTFDYTPALIQFVLSNPLVDVALVGMRDVARGGRECAALARCRWTDRHRGTARAVRVDDKCG